MANQGQALAHEFFKVFLPQTSTHRLLIPPAFQKHLQGIALWDAEIIDHAKRIWNVKVQREGDNSYISDGWTEFVKHHSLKYGEFLLFAYDGSSTFRVKIYPVNGCLIENNVVEEPESDKEMRKPKTEAEPSDIEVPRKRKRGSQTAQVKKKKKKKAGYWRNSAAMDAAKRYISNSKYPSFRVLFSPSAISKSTVRVSHNFLRKFIKGGSRYIRLQVSGRLWHVRMSVYEKLCACYLTSGWSVFEKENHIQEGDICVFELIKKAPVVLSVSIFRSSTVD